jgi:MFS family permease
LNAAAPGAFAPFRHRTFAVLWTAALLSNIGSWMHDTAAGWLMTTLTPSPAWVSLVQAATTLPVCLLCIPAGTLADRMDRRHLLLAAQALQLALALTLFVLTYAGLTTPLVLIGITFVLGIGTAVTSPSWQAILPSLVPRNDLPPAVALHAVGMNISRAIGPAVGGLIIVAAGVAWPFFVNAVSFVTILWALWWWKSAPPPPHALNESFIASMRAAFAHGASNVPLRNTLLRSVFFYVFGSCYWALLPLVARTQLHGTARLYGILVGAIGVGAVSGAVLLPPIRRALGLDGTVIAGTLGTIVAMSLYATVHVPALGVVASLVAGLSWLAALSSLNVAAQLAVPDHMRARGMALYTAVFYGCLALGSIGWGQVATHLGLTRALLLSCAGALLMLLPGRALRLQKR